MRFQVLTHSYQVKRREHCPRNHRGRNPPTDLEQQANRHEYLELTAILGRE